MNKDIKDFHVSEHELMADVGLVVDRKMNEAIVFLVHLEAPDWRGSMEFVLGPLNICANVLGLVDEEYGWPVMVDLDSVTAITDLSPGRRRHPFLYKNAKCVAVGIQMDEYLETKARIAGINFDI